MIYLVVKIVEHMLIKNATNLSLQHLALLKLCLMMV